MVKDIDYKVGSDVFAINDLLYVAADDNIQVYNFTNGELVNILKYPEIGLDYTKDQNFYAGQDSLGNVWLILSYGDRDEAKRYWAGYK